MSRRFQRIVNLSLIITLCFVFVFFVVKYKSNHDHGPRAVEIKSISSLINWEMENTRRISRINKTCEKYNLGNFKSSESEEIIKYPPAPQYSVFYIEKIYRITYCPIYKAGSTTWLQNLCVLMRIPEAELSSGREQISTIARRVIPELDYPEAEEAMQGTTKLLVVRHPFERLLSAYRDKLENSIAGREHGTLHFYRKYGAKIVRKYRDENFVPPRKDQVIHREGVPQPAGVEPTWKEFVKYLIETDLASYGDDHWMPYYLFCTPCSLDYSLVAKVETLDRDQIFAIQKLGLKKLIQPRWQHQVGQSNASSIYFSQLTKSEISKLHDKFKLDFEMFDYSPANYYQYALDYYRGVGKSIDLLSRCRALYQSDLDNL